MLIEKVRHAASQGAWQEAARVAERRFWVRPSVAEANADPQASDSSDSFSDATCRVAGSPESRFPKCPREDLALDVVERQ